jgi:hypothetical protein
MVSCLLVCVFGWVGLVCWLVWLLVCVLVWLVGLVVGWFGCLLVWLFVGLVVGWFECVRAQMARARVLMIDRIASRSDITNQQLDNDLSLTINTQQYKTKVTAHKLQASTSNACT